MISPKFSIIIPVYNTEQYLEKCLDSVLNQTFGAYECIIVDDNSTDGSLERIKKYLNMDSRFVLLRHEKNKGQSTARNTGIRKAIGEYLVFLDSDDFLLKEALDILHRIVEEREKPDVIVNSNYGYDDIGEKYHKRQISVGKDKMLGVKLFEKIERCYVLAPWCVTPKREYILKNSLWFPDGILHEDELWVPLVILNSEWVVYNEEAFYANRCGRRNSTVQTKNIKKIKDKLFVIDELQKYASQKSDRVTNIILQRCGKLMVGVIKDSAGYKEDPLYNQLRRDIIKYLPILKRGRLKYKMFYCAGKMLGISGMARILEIVCGSEGRKLRQRNN